MLTLERVGVGNLRLGEGEPELGIVVVHAKDQYGRNRPGIVFKAVGPGEDLNDRRVTGNDGKATLSIKAAGVVVRVEPEIPFTYVSQPAQFMAKSKKKTEITENDIIKFSIREKAIADYLTLKNIAIVAAIGLAAWYLLGRD